MTQFNRNASYVQRNSLHPTQGSKRESLAHPHAQCKQRDSFQLMDTALHKSELQSGGNVGVFCFDCVVVQKDLVFLQIFFSPLSVCIPFVCFFNIRNLDFTYPWKTPWLSWNNDNKGVKTEKWNGKNFAEVTASSFPRRYCTSLSNLYHYEHRADSWMLNCWPWN